jgi:hypothetical protein
MRKVLAVILAFCVMSPYVAFAKPIVIQNNVGTVDIPPAPQPPAPQPPAEEDAPPAEEDVEFVRMAQEADVDGGRHLEEEEEEEEPDGPRAVPAEDELVAEPIEPAEDEPVAEPAAAVVVDAHDEPIAPPEAAEEAHRDEHHLVVIGGGHPVAAPHIHVPVQNPLMAFAEAFLDGGHAGPVGGFGGCAAPYPGPAMRDDEAPDPGGHHDGDGPIDPAEPAAPVAAEPVAVVVVDAHEPDPDFEGGGIVHLAGGFDDDFVPAIAVAPPPLEDVPVAAEPVVADAPVANPEDVPVAAPVEHHVVFAPLPGADHVAPEAAEAAPVVALVAQAGAAPDPGGDPNPGGEGGGGGPNPGPGNNGGHGGGPAPDPGGNPDDGGGPAPDPGGDPDPGGNGGDGPNPDPDPIPNPNNNHNHGFALYEHLGLIGLTVLSFSTGNVKKDSTEAEYEAAKTNEWELGVRYFDKEGNTITENEANGLPGYTYAETYKATYQPEFGKVRHYITQVIDAPMCPDRPMGKPRMIETSPGNYRWENSWSKNGKIYVSTEFTADGQPLKIDYHGNPLHGNHEHVIPFESMDIPKKANWHAPLIYPGDPVENAKAQAEAEKARLEAKWKAEDAEWELKNKQLTEEMEETRKLGERVLKQEEAYAAEREQLLKEIAADIANEETEDAKIRAEFADVYEKLDKEAKAKAQEAEKKGWETGTHYFDHNTKKEISKSDLPNAESYMIGETYVSPKTKNIVHELTHVVDAPNAPDYAGKWEKVNVGNGYHFEKVYFKDNKRYTAKQYIRDSNPVDIDNDNHPFQKELKHPNGRDSKITAPEGWTPNTEAGGTQDKWDTGTFYYDPQTKLKVSKEEALKLSNYVEGWTYEGNKDKKIHHQTETVKDVYMCPDLPKGEWKEVKLDTGDSYWERAWVKDGKMHFEKDVIAKGQPLHPNNNDHPHKKNAYYGSADYAYGNPTQKQEYIPSSDFLDNNDDGYWNTKYEKEEDYSSWDNGSWHEDKPKKEEWHAPMLLPDED